MSQAVLLLSVGGELGADAERRVRERLAGAPVELREVASAAEALKVVREHVPDLVLLEMVLPDQTGLGFCRTLRESEAWRRVPVIMVTSYASEIDRVLAFEEGVDDFVPRPCSPRELASRVLAVLRRSSGRGRRESLRGVRHGRLAFDPTKGAAEVDGRRVPLTPTELQVLAVLIQHQGRVLTRRQVLKQVWGEEGSRTDRLVDVQVKAIRRKLGPAKECIQTVRGVGYRFSEEA